MKKSLVISTIATVLVVVVALTTATFAWFTTSGVAETSSKFIVAQSGGNVDLYTWNKTLPTPAFNAAPIATREEMALGLYTGTYEWDAAHASGAFDPGQNTNAQTDYRPLMPVKVIDSTVTDNTETNNVGLPDIDFIAAEAKTGGKIDVTNVGVKPVVARFQLQTGNASTTATLTLSLEIPNPPTPNDLNAVKNVRIVILGTSANPSATAQSFQFGTDYHYITNAPATADADDDAFITPIYETKNFITTDSGVVATATEIIQKMSFASISTDRLSVDQTISFQMTGGVPVDCVMYLWLEGDSTDTGSSRGEFTFELVVSGVDNNAGGEGA